MDDELNDYGREVKRGPKMRFVKAAIEWAEAQDYGTYYAGDAATWISDNVRGQLRIGKITAAELVGAMPGWHRDGATLTKLRPGQRRVMPAAEGFRLWSLVAPHRASAKDMAAHFNQWSAGRYATISARGIVDGLRRHGYKVIARPHNVAVYGREADIILPCQRGAQLVARSGQRCALSLRSE